ncbi:hypothetical protein SAMN04488548_11534 [Gordonia westfalica]|uniref:Uncharacterized protein n=1 Tax=Gordonia westfalica TaxID=158898 RepID=A0A1H2DQW0_9ACTN|nr:hypothetical protein [Gordonia westfalica]SDT85141.1 hypothetical protein SAMN04488548_11534 [Gordonia westfalica]
MELIADWALVVLAVLATVYTICYAAWQYWWKERVSLIYLGKSTLMSLVFLQISASVWRVLTIRGGRGFDSSCTRVAP